MDNFYVYLYIRENTTKHGAAGTPYYVGKGRGMRAYMRHNRIRTPQNPAMIIFVAQNLSEQDAFSEEKRQIAKYGRLDNRTGILGNLTDGGEGVSGRKATPEENMRNSERTKKRMTTEMRARLSAASKANGSGFKPGHQHSPEVCARLSASAKERMTPEMRAQISAKLKEVGAGAPLGNKHFAGHHHTAETRMKMSQVQQGREISKETRARMRVAARERCTPEVRARMAQSQRNRFEAGMPEEVRLKMSAAQRMRYSREKALQQEGTSVPLSAA
jgi:hypothetical protein